MREMAENNLILAKQFLVNFFVYHQIKKGENYMELLQKEIISLIKKINRTDILMYLYQIIVDIVTDTNSTAS